MPSRISGRKSANSSELNSIDASRGMGDNEIGDVEGLEFGFVAVEELLADGVRTIVTGRIGLPGDVRGGEQIGVHRVA